MGGCFSSNRKHKGPPRSFTEISACNVTAEKRIAPSIDRPDSWQTNGELSSTTVTLGASLMATSSDVHIQKQMQAFHSEQHRGLYKMWSELDMLADLHLDSVLGQGGFAVVMHGFWRGSTSVAVKLVATKAMRTGPVEDSQLSTVSSASTSLPVPALFEALLSRDLAHPNIIKCFDVRCCKLSKPFVTLLRNRAQHRRLHQLTGILRSHTTACDSQEEVEEEEDVKQVLRSMTGYTGRTPLWSSKHPSAVLPAHRGGVPTDSANCSAVSGPAWLMSTLGSLAHVDESPGSDQCCHASPGSLEVLAGQPRQQGQQGQQGRVCVPELAGLAYGSGEAHEAFQGKSAGEVSLQSLDVPSLDGFGSVAGSSLPAHGLSWEHILNKLDVGAADHLTLIVMEHAKCGTLLSAIRTGIFTRPPMAPEAEKRRRLRALLRTAREVAMGLEHLHDACVVHGDLKPANVLLTDSRADTRGFQAALSDFGLSCLVADHKSRNKRTSGTSAYMAPELFRDGQASPSTDIYAFGITLWELVHGRQAYRDPDPCAVMLAVLHGERPVWTAPLEAQLTALANLYRRCVSPSPDARPSAAELVCELGKLEDSARLESHRQSKELMRQQQASKQLGLNRGQVQAAAQQQAK